MSSNPARNEQNGNQQQLPSWEEFNISHEEGPIDLNIGDEPGQSEEFGPSLPPGFGVEDLHHDEGEQQQTNNGNELLLNDFLIPLEAYDSEDPDPEDPLQCSSSVNSKRVIGPQIPSSLLPKIPQQKADEHMLPSIGNSNSAVVDFITDQPCCSQQICTFNGLQQIVCTPTIGPALPPDLILSSSSNQIDVPKASFPIVDGLDDIGPALPPDEPQCSNNLNQNVGQHTWKDSSEKHSQERIIGLTLPCSSDEDEEVGTGYASSDVNTSDGNDLMNCNDKKKETESDEDNDKSETMVIGPMLPSSEISEEEEHAEYLARLAQFEANKEAKASNGTKREEWMTELPQKMLKTGAFGLSAKTSFSRSTAGPSSSKAAKSAWTTVPNGAQKKNEENVASASKAVKRPEQDEWEEKRANELNKNRKETLMDMHQKKRKIETSGSGPSTSLIRTSTGERRPFNRDTDVEVHGLGGNPAALKERMGDLGNRFGHSAERKFL